MMIHVAVGTPQIDTSPFPDVEILSCPENGCWTLLYKNAAFSFQKASRAGSVSEAENLDQGLAMALEGVGSRHRKKTLA
jgi:hypothetical protein